MKSHFIRNLKPIKMPSFVKANEVVYEVSKIEKLNHHPIITINGKTVKLSLKSFDVDAITIRDLNLTREIEKAVKNI